MGKHGMQNKEQYRGYIIGTTQSFTGEYISIVGNGNQYNSDEELQDFKSYDDAKDFIDKSIRQNKLPDLTNRVFIGVSDDNSLTYNVKTAGGVLEVKNVSEEYPDVGIYINGHCVAFVEWHPYDGQFNLRYFGMDDNEPVQTFENITEIPARDIVNPLS
jgi:hypothetical protein